MKASFIDAAGQRQEITLDATVYKEAHDACLTVPQFLARKYPTDPEKYGHTFAQIAASCGMYLAGDKAYGLRAPSIRDVIEGVAGMQAGTIVRDAAPASRILFPAVVIELMEDKLLKDMETDPAVFEKLIAITNTIAGERYEQPIVSYTAPEKARSQAIGQLAVPLAMMTITTSQIARNIPTFSLGLEISDQAQRASTLDLVTLALTRQALFERQSRVEGYINAFLAGDTDMGQAALSSATSTSYDAAASGGVLTHLAWIKFLYHNFKKRRIDYVICDLATALKIENRTGKPIVTTDDPNSPRIDATVGLVNPGINPKVKIFLVEDGIVPAGTILGLDSRYAIRRVRNSEAEYAAVEQFVLKKSSAMRFDFGEVCYRLFDEAWDVMTIA